MTGFQPRPGLRHSIYDPDKSLNSLMIKKRMREGLRTLQWGRATVMISSALTSMKRTVCPVRTFFVLTANLVMRPLMRCGRYQVTTTKVWFWAYAVRLVTRPGAAGNTRKTQVCSPAGFVSDADCVRLLTWLSSFYVYRFAVGSCSHKWFSCYLKHKRDSVFVCLLAKYFMNRCTSPNETFRK